MEKENAREKCGAQKKTLFNAPMKYSNILYIQERNMN